MENGPTGFEGGEGPYAPWAWALRNQTCQTSEDQSELWTSPLNRSTRNGGAGGTENDEEKGEIRIRSNGSAGKKQKLERA